MQRSKRPLPQALPFRPPIQTLETLRARCLDEPTRDGLGVVMLKLKSKRRAENRVNLRFRDEKFLDQLEILAHSKGLTLPTWIRSVLMRELNFSEEKKILANRVSESTLVSHKLLERLLSPEDVSDARKKVQNYLQSVKKHVRKDDD